MGLMEDLALRALSGMSSEERRDLMVTVVDHMLEGMSGQDRQVLMQHVVDHFLDTLPNEERARTVRELVPSLMAQLMKSGNMSVDDLLWTAMGSLGALEKPHEPQQEQEPGPTEKPPQPGANR